MLNRERTGLAAAVAAACLCACDAGPSPEPASDADANRGGRLLAQYHCGTCHTIPGVPAARGRVAVTLAAFGRRSYIAGHVPNTPGQLARWIEDPAAVVPETTMPDMAVSPRDARDMAAYLSALR